MRRSLALFISILGFWIFSTALTFPENRMLLFSDLASGILLIVLGVFSLHPKREWSLWCIVLVGLWVQFASLLFWTTHLWQYLNATACGMVAMILALHTLSRPPVSPRAEIPYNGWSFNPSSWNFRIPNIFFSLLCAFIARYLAAFQLGLIPSVWDPIFGDGTHQVLTSTVSDMFPLSDAGLGSLAYMIEALMGFQGDAQRWRTMPWAVVLFGFLVVPVSIVSITLIILQPIAVGAWCSWCLLIAFIMVFMIPLAVGEFVAGLRFLHQSVRQGKPFWKLFWYGEDISAKVVSAPFARPNAFFSPSGVSFPWNLMVSAALGLWIIFSAHIFPLPAMVADSDYISGPFIFTISIVSCAEIVRVGRFLNLPFALWLMIVPWWAGEITPWAILNHVGVALALILLALRKGPVHQRYGKLQRFIF